MHCGYIVKVDKLRKHENADRLQIATFFGNDTCVGLNVVMGEIGIYFPSDLQLSEEFCEVNHLCRKKKDGTLDTGYLDENKRNIRAIKLRGEKSDGIFCPLSSVAYTGINLEDLKVGDTIDILNGHEICKKYIPKSNHSNTSYKNNKVNKTRKHKVPVAPLFMEHADTEQLAYNLGAFKVNDEIEITLKMHGTSQRTGYLPILKGHKRTLWDRITHKEGKPIYDWGYVSGTRRVVLENFEGGFYGSNAFREAHSKFFEGKLNKGETVYYEVVGFTDTGTPIMAKGDNKKLNDKDFIKQYGETTVFSYGCAPDGYSVKAYWDDEETEPAILSKVPQSDIYVYRMTMTNEDGFVVEYTPDFRRYRCEQMGVKTVSVMWKGVIPPSFDIDVFGDGSIIEKFDINAGEWIKNVAEQFYDGPDPIGKTHVREGVVVRIINRPKFAAYKCKNYNFKMLEGLIKETAEAPDMEEREEILEEAQDV